MSELPFAESYRDLVVYRKQRTLSRALFIRSKGFPPEERYSLTDQMRRAVRSIGAQLAEAWAKRRYEKHFVSKLTDSDGERLETEHWLVTAHDSGYLSAEETRTYVGQCKELGALLGSMIEYPERFCRPSLRVAEGISDFAADSSDY